MKKLTNILWLVALAALSSSAALAANLVAPVTPSICITPAHPCATALVNITRDDAIPMRGYSVTFTLSPELTLCGPVTSSVTEGGYLTSGGGTTSYFPRSNGGGSYTVDDVILGLPCGATAPSGTFFNIAVTNTGGSGTGTVTVTSVTLRDCNNGSIAAAAGSPASVTIDLAPVSVAPISDPTLAEALNLSVTPVATLTPCASGPISWTAAGLPSGANINPLTGEVTWTPDCQAFENGPLYGPVTVTAHAASGDQASTSFSIHVTDTPGSVSVSVVSPPPVQELSPLAMAPSSATLTSCAFPPVTWSVFPALPAGAILNPNTGVVSWTPACGQAGTYGLFTLKATAATGEIGTGAFSLVVTHHAGTVTVSVTDPPPVQELSALAMAAPSAVLTACATGPVTWSSSPLPPGASLNPSTGVVSWTPACGQVEVWGPFTLTATAATGETGSGMFSIVVTHHAGTVSVAPIPDPTVAELSLLTVSPSATLTACAAAPLAWSATGLPVGASINPGTGVITWTPDCRAFENGPNYGPVTVRALASTGEFGTRSFTIHVSDTPGTVAAITNLSATQIKLGNDADGTTKIKLTFTLPAGVVAVDVYRAGFRNYPEYDDLPGAGVPATPGYPPGAPWVLTSVHVSGQTDETTQRDFYYYVAFCKDACGDVSPVSDKTGGTLNYFLGDVHDGITNCQGNNRVTLADVSFLGAHYGTSLGVSDPLGCLDVGPTTDHSVDGRPTTDDQLDFEDLVLFAINFGVVSGPESRITPPAASADELRIRAPSLPSVGSTFDVELEMSGAGDIQAASVELDYDSAVVEPISVSGGDLLSRQTAGSTVLSSRPGNVDWALLGVGGGLSGTGTVAHATFRVKVAGDPKFSVKRAIARDATNQPVVLNHGQPVSVVTPPARTYLASSSPNPFTHSTTVRLGLKVSGVVKLSVYDLQGREVRSLLSGYRMAGELTVVWDGRDNGGVALAPGLYLIRIAAEGASISHSVRLVR